MKEWVVDQLKNQIEALKFIQIKAAARHRYIAALKISKMITDITTEIYRITR